MNIVRQFDSTLHLRRSMSVSLYMPSDQQDMSFLSTDRKRHGLSWKVVLTCAVSALDFIAVLVPMSIRQITCVKVYSF